jgi:hypothetical protein
MDMEQDTIMIPDVGLWDLAVYLRSQGWAVWEPEMARELEIQKVEGKGNHEGAWASSW